MLNDIHSIVNNYEDAQDFSRAFTFIEFIKAWGFNNDSNTFITLYRDYLTAWAEKNSNNLEVTQSDFVRERMTNILRNITLTYSSYEEQDFIAHIDWNDKTQIKTLIPFYARKIKDICEFYRNKRNTVALTFNRNNYKGSRKSIEQIIYEKLVDFLFNNKNLTLQVSDIQRDLMISIDNYIDTFSEYFDIPRKQSYRANRNFDNISANMNEVEAASYLKVEEVIADIIYSGDVHLEEIPLIAQLGLDLNQECVGDMLILKNSLVANNTINLIPLTEQVALRRKLWQKYLGCDLYYMYINDSGEVTMDLMCRAENPTGNLLNSQMSDTATTPAKSYELLSNIGLFFKPDKNSILKVNAKNYTYEIDVNVAEKNTIYVFPDPTMYGDIGNNKTDKYPLIMVFKLDYDIKNLSAGFANNDPAFFIGSPNWQSYFTKEDEILNNIKNYDYEYGFTSLANKGIISNYQVDVWGNQFGLFKGYHEEYEIDSDGNKILKEISISTTEDPETYGKVTEEEIPEEDESKYILLNGGYFEDPRHPGYYDENKNYVAGAKFDFDVELDLTHTGYNSALDTVITDTYKWTGMKLRNKPFIVPTAIYNSVDGMNFGSSSHITYIDHYGYGKTKLETTIDKEDVIFNILTGFLSKTLADSENEKVNIPHVIKKVDRNELAKSEGCLYIRDAISFDKKPLKLLQAFPWLSNNGETSIDIWGDITLDNIIDFIVMNSTLIVETKNNIIAIPYKYDENGFSSSLGLNVPIVLPKEGKEITKILYNEKEQQFYILQLDRIDFDKTEEHEAKIALIPVIYKFDARNYRIEEIFNPYNTISSNFNNSDLMSDIKRIIYKNANIREYIEANKESVYELIFDDKNEILSNFGVEYSYDFNLNDATFSYNNNYDNYAITFSYVDASSTPFIHEFKFPILLINRYLSKDDASEASIIADKLETNIYTLLDSDGKPLVTELWGDMLDTCELKN